MNPTIYRPSLTIALAAMLGACSSATEVSAVTQPDVSFSVGEGTSMLPGQPILPLVPQLRVSEGRVDVLGHFRTNTPCWSLASRLQRSGNVITLTVTALEATAGACAQVITVRPYEARIEPLTAGRYTVVVVHEYASGSPKPEEVLRQELVVP